MRLQYLQHVPFEDPANIIPWAESRGFDVHGMRLFSSETLQSPQNYDWLVVMGGPMGVHDEKIYPWMTAEKRYIRKAIDSGKVVIGICLGAQLIADVLGAEVGPNAEREIGWFPVTRTASSSKSTVFSRLPFEFSAFHWHGDTFAIPEGAVHLASSEACQNQAFSIEDRIFGLQFHLESAAETIEGLLSHCGHELVPGPHVQRAEQIREACPTQIPAIQGLMATFLDAIAAQS